MTTILLPYFDRPEMLWHCLSNIDKAEKPGPFTLLMKPDWGMSPKNQREHHAVISQFIRLNPIIIGPRRHYFKEITKQSANVLNGLFLACQDLAPDDVIHLIEDDVMVGPDHFTWSAERHAHHGGFCVTTSHNCNGPNLGTKPDGYYSCQGQYRGIGTSFRAGVLRKYLFPHITPDYYSNPKHYIQTTFTPDPFNGAWCEQDGLIRRIQMRSCMPIAYATTPKSFHAGWYGKNRRAKMKPIGNLTQRIDYVGKVIYDPDEMRRHCQNEMYYQDSIPINFAVTTT